MSRRWRRKGRAVPPLGGMNMIPLVNMGMVLLLILLISSPSLYIVRLPVQLPTAEAAAQEDKAYIRVVLSLEEKLSIEGNILAGWHALPEALREEMEKSSRNAVILNIDKRVPYRVTSRLLTLIQKNTSVARIAIGTKTQDGKNGS